MDKYWKQGSEKTASLFVNQEEVVSLDLTNKKNIMANFNDNQFTIKYKYRQSRILQVFDEDEQLVAQTFRKKWYSNHVRLEYQEQEYLIKSRNNPLFEAVLQNLKKQDILAYGIEIVDFKEVIRINDNRNSEEQLNYIFDTILWIIFSSVPRMDDVVDVDAKILQ